MDAPGWFVLKERVSRDWTFGCMIHTRGIRGLTIFFGPWAFTTGYDAGHGYGVTSIDVEKNRIVIGD